MSNDQQLTDFEHLYQWQIPQLDPKELTSLNKCVAQINEMLPIMMNEEDFQPLEEGPVYNEFESLCRFFFGDKIPFGFIQAYKLMLFQLYQTGKKHIVGQDLNSKLLQQQNKKLKAIGDKLKKLVERYLSHASLYLRVNLFLIAEVLESIQEDSFDENLLQDFLVMKDRVNQRFLTLSFVGGQLYRTFEESSAGVFLPVLALFGEKYENFQDNRIARKEDFEAIRPYFTYKEISNSGSSIQRENPEDTAQEILELLSND